jgi:hypothetical protein
MEKIGFRLLLLSFLVLLLFVGCRNAPESFVFSGTIKGTVYAQGKTDHSDTDIKVVDESLVSYNMTTASDGLFSFADLPDGLYSFSAIRSGYSSASANNISISKSSEYNIGEIILTRNTPPEIPVTTNRL